MAYLARRSKDKCLLESHSFFFTAIFQGGVVPLLLGWRGRTLFQIRISVQPRTIVVQELLALFKRDFALRSHGKNLTRILADATFYARHAYLFARVKRLANAASRLIVRYFDDTFFKFVNFNRFRLSQLLIPVALALSRI